MCSITDPIIKLPILHFKNEGFMLYITYEQN